MKSIISLSMSMLLCVSLAGCFFEKPKPIYKIKRVYIKAKVAKAPPECHAKFAEIKPLPKKSGLNEMTQEVILQRAGRTKDRAGFSVCQTYAQKVSGK